MLPMMIHIFVHLALFLRLLLGLDVYAVNHVYAMKI